MHQQSGPVPSFPLAERALRTFQDERDKLLPDFSDTATAFAHLSNRELRETRWLFRLMGKPWLTNFMGRVGLRAVEWGLPGAAQLVRETLYQQFVGGRDLERVKRTVAKLAERNVGTVLDYGSEGLQTPAGVRAAHTEFMRATDFAGATPDVWGSVVKVTSLIPFTVLERYNDRRIDFDNPGDAALAQGIDLLDEICRLGRGRGCEVYLDAEESWVQSAIDQIAEEMMRRHNASDRPTVITTIQLYRWDRLPYLKALHQRAAAKNILLGVKLVRGAYIVKERVRAEEMGYPSPIQPNLAATHRDYDAAVAYCLAHRDEIVTVLATHNEESTRRLLRGMQEAGVPHDHPHLRFSQLLGMSDNLTFNLAEAGYRVSKYTVYGPVREVLPYLLRRAQENTSVTGETGRELSMLERELKRRGE